MEAKSKINAVKKQTKRHVERRRSNRLMSMTRTKSNENKEIECIELSAGSDLEETSSYLFEGIDVDEEESTKLQTDERNVKVHESWGTKELRDYEEQGEEMRTDSEKRKNMGGIGKNMEIHDTVRTEELRDDEEQGEEVRTESEKRKNMGENEKKHVERRRSNRLMSMTRTKSNEDKEIEWIELSAGSDSSYWLEGTDVDNEESTEQRADKRNVEVHESWGTKELRDDEEQGEEMTTDSEKRKNMGGNEKNVEIHELGGIEELGDDEEQGEEMRTESEKRKTMGENEKNVEIHESGGTEELRDDEEQGKEMRKESEKRKNMGGNEKEDAKETQTASKLIKNTDPTYDEWEEDYRGFLWEREKVEEGERSVSREEWNVMMKKVMKIRKGQKKLIVQNQQILKVMKEILKKDEAC